MYCIVRCSIKDVRMTAFTYHFLSHSDIAVIVSVLVHISLLATDVEHSDVTMRHVNYFLIDVFKSSFEMESEVGVHKDMA